MSTLLPKWMRQIIDNPSLLADFIEDLSKRHTSATQEGVKASKEGNIYSANTLFGKAEAFESLKNSVLIQNKEMETQDAFHTQQTGSKSAARTGKGRSARG